MPGGCGRLTFFSVGFLIVVRCRRSCSCSWTLTLRVYLFYSSRRIICFPFLFVSFFFVCSCSGDCGASLPLDRERPISRHARTDWGRGGVRSLTTGPHRQPVLWKTACYLERGERGDGHTCRVGDSPTSQDDRFPHCSFRFFLARLLTFLLKRKSGCSLVLSDGIKMISLWKKRCFCLCISCCSCACGLTGFVVPAYEKHRLSCCWHLQAMASLSCLAGAFCVR
jgi:hypothetical protein